MELFKTFTQTIDRASDYCDHWKDTYDGTTFNYAEMMLLAAHMDSGYPLSEDTFYVVFPDGEIAFVSRYNDEMTCLYKPMNKKGVKQKFTGDEFYPRETKFCPACGQQLPASVKFCTSCGKEQPR
jgi:hypothetical protein